MEIQVRTNDEVTVIGMVDDIGIGVVQGYTTQGLPIVRIPISNLTSKGERYLKNKVCLTGKAKSSRLYVINHDEITVRRHGSKRQNTQDTE